MWPWHRKPREAKPLNALDRRTDDLVSGLEAAQNAALQLAEQMTTLEAWLYCVESAMHTGSVVMQDGQEAVGMAVELLHQTENGEPHDVLECLTDQLLKEGVSDE